MRFSKCKNARSTLYKDMDVYQDMDIHAHAFMYIYLHSCFHMLFEPLRNLGSSGSWSEPWLLELPVAPSALF